MATRLILIFVTLFFAQRVWAVVSVDYSKMPEVIKKSASTVIGIVQSMRPIDVNGFPCGHLYELKVLHTARGRSLTGQTIKVGLQGGMKVGDVLRALLIKDPERSSYLKALEGIRLAQGLDSSDQTKRCQKEFSSEYLFGAFESITGRGRE